MSKLPFEPLNDHCLVECKSKYGVFGAADDEMGQDGYSSGVVLKVSDQMNYFSAPGWIFEDSLVSFKQLAIIKDRYKKLEGREIRWEQFSERGQTVEHDGKVYAFIRLTKIVGVKNG